MKIEMICRVAASTLLLLIPAVFGDDGKHAVQFTADKFAADVPQSPHFVMFFAPWCGHCQRLKPTWEDLAKKLHNDAENDFKVTVGQVDCTVETALCSEQDVTGYPTLKLFKPGQAEAIRYRGQRDLGSLETFLKDNLSTKKTEDQKPVETEGEGKPVTGAVDLTESDFHQHVAHGDHFVKFFAPWCGHCQRLAPTWEELAQSLAHDNRASIAKVDCTQHRTICNEFDVKGYPTLLWIRDGKKVDKYQGSRSHEDLKAFVEQMTGGAKKEAEVPDEKKDDGKVPDLVKGNAVVQLVEANFENGIAKGVTFVKFYAPWCGHCKRMASTWDQLAVKFVGSPVVKIAKVDCTESDNRQLCSAQGVNGFPTMFVYRDGKRLEEYDGTRTLDDMHSFVTRFLAHDEL